MSEGLVGKCKVADIFDDPDCAVLFEEASDECANPLLGRTCPQRAMYEAIETAGAGQCIAVYYGGRMVGFAFVVMSVLPHYGRKFAVVESLFLRRSAKLGNLLLEVLEDTAAGEGCAAIFYSAPVGSRLAELMGRQSKRYQQTNLIFSKRLK